MSTPTKRVTYIAPWVLPISSPPIRDGLVAVEEGKIVYVGKISDYQDVPERTGPDNYRLSDTHGGGGIIMPGLVNAHTHLELTVMRGMLEGLHFREWLRVLTEARAKVLDGEALLDSSMFGIREGLLAGITTYGDTTSSGIPLEAMRRMGVRGIGYVEVFGPADEVALESMTGLKARIAELSRHDTDLVKTGVSPHAPYTVSETLFKRVAQFARANKLPVAIHVAESEAEIEFVRDGTGPFAFGHHARGITVTPRNRSPIQYLANTGILDDTRALLIHCIRVSEADLAIIAERGCTIVHCPISNAKLGHGIAPLELMLNAGIPTGLGSDSVASNNAMDILTEARLATLFQSVRRALPDALSATNALRMATLGGAQALGLDSTIGSLEVGKDADVAMFDFASHEGMAVFDPADLLVHTLAGRSAVSTVLVKGEARVLGGKLVNPDLSLTWRTSQIGERLVKWREETLGS